jgi:hypothetical protein
MSILKSIDFSFWRLRYFLRLTIWEMNLVTDMQKMNPAGIPVQLFHDVARDSLFYIFLTEQLDLLMACRYSLKSKKGMFLRSSGRTRAHQYSLMKTIQMRKEVQWEVATITLRKNRKGPNLQSFFRSLVQKGMPVHTPDGWLSLLQEHRRLDRSEALMLVETGLQTVTRSLIEMSRWNEIDKESPVGSFQRNFYELFRAYSAAFDLQLPSFQVTAGSASDLIEHIARGLARSLSIFEMWTRINSRYPGARNLAMEEFVEFIEDSSKKYVSDLGNEMPAAIDASAANALSDRKTCEKIAIHVAQLFDQNQGPSR